MRRIDGPQAIAAAVLSVGFDRLTVERVAAALGVTHSSLYKHVGGREHLVRLGVDRLFVELAPVAPDGGWRAMLERESWVIWDLVEDNRGLALEVAVQSDPPAAVTARMERVLELLVAAGFDAEAALLAVDLVADLALDVALRAHHIEQAHAGPEPLPPAREWFGRKLAVVLSGIASELAPA